jgi:hypothetical protein
VDRGGNGGDLVRIKAMKYECLQAEDIPLVEEQLGRSLRGDVRVASRCPFKVVQVIATSPFLEDGTPFPTLFWLTCPFLQRAVSRLENAEVRRALRRKINDDADFARELSEAEREYCEERELWGREIAGPGKDAFCGREGIAGTPAGGIKCLHAHLAHYLAGYNNPVGREVAAMLGDGQERDCGGDCRAFMKRRARAAR